MNQLARNFGIDEGDARNAVSQMVPVISRGIRNNAAQEGGLESLLNALSKSRHESYLDHPEQLSRRETVDDGNAILGHILGSKDVSRQVADKASAGTGLDSGILKQMLPILATLAMGALNKQASGAGMLGGAAPSSPSASSLGPLLSLLDADKDGSIADDLLGLAKKFF